MASKVNTKFVVGLSVGLLVVCAGVAGTAAYLLNNTAADNVRAGEKFVAAGDYNQAAEQFGKAVNKEKTNTAYLAKWVDALSKSNADNFTKYDKLYTDWVAAQRQQAVVDSGNVQAQRNYLELQKRLIDNGPFNQEAFQFLQGEADTMIRLHESGGPGSWEVLKRYRGLANAPLYFNAPTPRPEQLDALIADLKAALKADPADDETAVALADVALRRAAKSYEEQNKEEAAAFEKESDATLNSFLVANPDNPSILLSLVQRDVLRTQRALQEAGASADMEKASKDFTDRSIPILNRAFESAKKLPKPLHEDLLQKFRAVESLVVGSAISRTEELTRDSVRAKPDSPMLLAFLADVLTARGDTSGAIEQFAQIAKLPIPPVSAEGRALFEMQKAALAQQAYLSARAALSKGAGEERTASVARAKELRESLAKLESADSVRLMLVDATLAVLEGTPDATIRAGQLLDQYNRKTNKSNPEALFLAAQVAIKQNESGEARDLLEKLLTIQPTNITAMLMLGQLHANLQDYQQALQYYRNAARLDPTNEAARNGVELMGALSGAIESKDPAVRELLKAEAIRKSNPQGPETNQKMADVLGPAWEATKDPRIAMAYSGVLAELKQKDKALQVLDDAIKAAPDSTMLKDRRLMISSESPEEATLVKIEQSGASELDKTLSRFSMYASLGKEAEAQAQIDAAIKLAPEDPRVLELQFIRMLNARKFEDAKAIVERAVRSNADSQSGDTYRARLALEQGDTKTAVTVLQAAVQRGGAQPEVHRLLGRTLARDGRMADAAQSFRESLRMRPTDVPTTVDLLNTLVSMGNMTEALTVARDFQKHGEADLRFLPVWLDIEAAVGDRDLAIARREGLRQSRPNDRDNTLSLASLYIQSNKPEKARPLIDAVRATQDGLDALGLDAMCLWKQGDTKAARAVYASYIAKQEPAKVTQATGALASFLVERGDVAGAAEALEGVREKQDPTRMEVDRALSDLYMQSGRRDKALEATRRLVASKADRDDRIYQKRVLELLTLSGQLPEAQAALNELTTGKEPDLITLLLTAQLREAQKDIRGQAEALNQAVAKFPGESAAFLRRAEFFSKSESTQKDADADLSRAIELDPQNSVLHQRRAQLRMRLQREADAVLDMREAVRLAPGDNDLLFGTMLQLYQIGREQDMIELGSEASRQRARDAALQLAMGQFFQKLPMNKDNAARNMGLIRQYFEAAYKLDDAEYYALTYLGALLAYPDPDPTAAEKIITDAGEKAEKSPGYQMTLARIRIMQNKKPDALRLTQTALRLADQNNPAHMNAWMSDLAKMLTDTKERVAFLDSTGKAGLAPDWMLYYKSADQLNEPTTRQEGLAGIKQVATSTKILPLQQNAYFDLGRANMMLRQNEEAVKAWQDGLKLFPDHTEMLNNAAYVLAEELNRPTEAVPLAERAAERAPNSADVRDTLGRVYFLAGRPADAVPHLERAVALSATPGGALTVIVHLVEAQIAAGNLEGAKRSLDSGDQIAKRNPGVVTEDLSKKLQELRGKAEGK